MPNPVDSLIGAAVLFVPAWLVLFVLLRKQHVAIRRFALALLVVGIGYLVATGAAASIGSNVMQMVQKTAPAAVQPK